jgi:hypothetical protein
MQCCPHGRHLDKQTLRRLLLGEFTFKRLVRSLILIYVCFGLYVFFFADGKIFLPQPFSHEQKLFAAAREPKHYLWVDGADHNDFMWVAGDRYFSTLQEFAQLVKKTQS